VCINLASAQLSNLKVKERKTVYFKNNSFDVEVAKTNQEREVGLMFVKDLPANSGMLFIFENETARSFYMKNMLIPLDIIWMDKDKKIVFIKKDAQPANFDSYEVIRPDKPAMFVLELNAGKVDMIGLSIGDTLQF